MGSGLNLGGRTHGFIGSQAALGVDQVRRKDGVNQCGFTQTGLTLRMDQHCAQEKIVERNVPTHITLNWKPRFSSFRSICEVILSKPTWLRGKTEAGEAEAELAVAAMVKQDELNQASGRRDRDEGSKQHRRWLSGCWNDGRGRWMGRPGEGEDGKDKRRPPGEPRICEISCFFNPQKARRSGGRGDAMQSCLPDPFNWPRAQGGR